jgi:hypothetical protein
MIVGNKRETQRASSRLNRPKEKRDGYEVAPVNPEDIAWIAGLEAGAYSPEDAIPGLVLQEWYEANPTGFSVIRTHDGKRSGHIDILPLRPDTLSALIEGKILEREIRGSSLYRPGEKDKIEDLYVESVIILRPEGCSNAPAIRHVLSNFMALIGRICDLSGVRNIYAIAASKAGERGLRSLGFSKLEIGRGRPDRHDIFVAAFPVLADRLSALKPTRTRKVSPS